MLPAKYQPNLPGGSGEVIHMIFTIYGHGGHLEFHIMSFIFASYCITIT